MGSKLIVLQGAVFSVELVSNLGSANYGWCVSRLPEGIWLAGTESIPVTPGRSGSKTIQQFYFAAVQASEDESVTIEFALACMSEPDKVLQRHETEVKVLPGNSEKFVNYSENAVNTVMPYGYPDPVVEYGFPVNKYGFVCEAQNTVEKYGYPCGVQDAAVKYGYLCGAQDTKVAYGYPCGVQDTVVKYGYPCGAQDTKVAYGYPCGMQDTAVKYGYPCGAQDAAVKYGYPCGVQDTAVKYGYPCGVQEATLKYGYPCAAQTASMVYAYVNDGNNNLPGQR